MLINKLKSDCSSQVVAPQGKHIERRQNGASLSDGKSPFPESGIQMRGRSQTDQNLGQYCHWHQEKDEQRLAHCSPKADWANVTASNWGRHY